MQVLGELETIDDDCDKHGIQFVKIDDTSAAKEFGIDDIPALVYFEKGIPNLYDGKYASFRIKYNSLFIKILIHDCSKFS